MRPPFYLVAPLLALVTWLVLSLSNRGAVRELSALSDEMAALEEKLVAAPTPIEQVTASPPAPIPRPTRAEQEPPAEEELPPIVVPGTIEELASEMGSILLKMRALDEMLDRSQGSPLTGTERDDAERKATGEMMGSVAPLLAGIEVLNAEISTPEGAARLRGQVVDELLSLGETRREQLIEGVAEVYREFAEIEDGAAASAQLNGVIRARLSPSQLAGYEELFGDAYTVAPGGAFGLLYELMP